MRFSVLISNDIHHIVINFSLPINIAQSLVFAIKSSSFVGVFFSLSLFPFIHLIIIQIEYGHCDIYIFSKERKKKLCEIAIEIVLSRESYIAKIESERKCMRG